MYPEIFTTFCFLIFSFLEDIFLHTTFTHTHIHTHDRRPLPTTHDPRHLATYTLLMEGRNRRTDWRILKYFCPDFGFKARYDLTTFRILQLRIHPLFGPSWILDFACNNDIFARILIQGEILRRICIPHLTLLSME